MGKGGRTERFLNAPLAARREIPIGPPLYETCGAWHARRSMKILVVDSSETFGGAFELALTLVRYLAQIPGAEPVLVSAQPDAVLRSRVPAPLRYYRVVSGTAASLQKVESWPCKAGVLYKLLVHELPAACKLAWLSLKERAEVLHLNNMLNSQLHGVLAAWLTRRVCVSCHREYEHNSPLIRFFERGVTAHVVGSKLIAADVAKLGVAAEKIVCIWDGADARTFSPDVAAADLHGLFGVPIGRKVFGIFGRLMEWKGQHIFLRAAAEVCRHIPEVHALIVGGPSDGDPGYVDRLKRLAHELGIESRVTFTGFRADVAPLMRACEALVHASLRPEPFGTAVLEGMGCGVPYVAMNEGGPAEMIEDGTSGMLVPPGDASAMAGALTAILADSQLRERMGKAARERFLGNLSAEVFARRHFELYRCCLSGG